jgi:hypothetical protein
MKDRRMVVFFIITVLGMFLFSATVPSTPYLLIPKGGENWALGSTQNITWNAVGYNCVCQLILQRNGRNLGYIVQNHPISSGSFSWNVGKFSSAKIIKTAAPGSGYTIMLHGARNGQRFQNFSRPFSIASVVLK